MNRRARSRPLRLGLFCRGRARHGECPGARLWCTGIGARSPGIGARWGSKALCKKGRADLTNSPVSLNPGLLNVLVCDDVARLDVAQRACTARCWSPLTPSCLKGCVLDMFYCSNLNSGWIFKWRHHLDPQPILAPAKHSSSGTRGEE